MSFYDLNLTQGGDIKTARSFLNQLIDVLQEDISGSTSRRKYQHFVTGGVGPGITSSLFQTVYDQDFTLQTANAVFDITFGLAPPNVISFANNGTAAITTTGVDVTGKYLYPSSSLMMREKTDIYSQFAQILLGNANSKFKIPLESAVGQGEDIDVALFVAFKRLFSRDQIKRETFAMRFYQSASHVNGNGAYPDQPPLLVGGVTSDGVTNLGSTSTSGSAIYTDLNSATAQFTAFGGQYGEIVDSAATDRKVGLLFYDAGVAVFNLSKIVSGSQFMSGAIDAMHPAGVTMLGGEGTETFNTAKFIPDFVTSGSIDNVVDHICGTRFQSGSMTAITFQNVTNINSTLVFCRVRADDANYSSNPTFIDSNGRIIVIDEGQEAFQEPFTYVTSVGLYDDSSPPRLLAVAKLSRPVEKNSERDLTFRVRLDY